MPNDDSALPVRERSRQLRGGLTILSLPPCLDCVCVPGRRSNARRDRKSVTGEGRPVTRLSNAGNNDHREEMAQLSTRENGNPAHQFFFLLTARPDTRDQRPQARHPIKRLRAGSEEMTRNLINEYIRRQETA